MDWLKVLVVVHVLSAIIGVGPTFFGHVLVHRTQTPAEYRQALKIIASLEYFPKIGGSLAVVTGIVLVWLGSYGSFLQVWLVGSLVLYVLIQTVIIARVIPISKQLAAWLNDPANHHVQTFPAQQKRMVASISNWYYAASGMGVLLFVLMIVKP